MEVYPRLIVLISSCLILIYMYIYEFLLSFLLNNFPEILDRSRLRYINISV